MSSDYESVVAFLSGVDENDRIAATAFRTWLSRTNPAEYNETSSTAAKWGDTLPGTSGSVTYWFDDNSGWTPDEQGAFEACMALWMAVANVSITEAASAAASDFLIVRGTDGAFWTPGSPTPVPIGGDRLTSPPPLDSDGDKLQISYQPSSFGTLGPDIGSKANGAYSTLIHELGHMLGLGHAGPYNSNNVASQQFSPYDMTLWSIMSYFEPHEDGRYAESYPVTGTSWGTDSTGKHYEPLTPMMLDILAIQRLYGAATTGPLTGGGHVFGFNANIEGPIGQFYDFNLNHNPIVTIWESGRGNTLDLSGFSDDALINLNAGTFSSAGGKTNNIGIAFGTVIETGIGGSGNDRIIASDVGSTLDGRDGSDDLRGGLGNDILTGGADPDTLHPGGGLNVLRDTFENMDGDTVFDFGQSTTIDVAGALIGRLQLGVAQSGGSTTLTMGETEMLLEGVYSGGDFMAVARASGVGLHTEITFEPFLPTLFEGVSVAPQAVNGIANQSFLTGDGLVRFSATLNGGISSFNNTVGWYTVAADGTIRGVDILFANAHAPGQTTISLGIPASGEQIGFFLIQDGFDRFGALPEDLSFLNQGSLTPGNAFGGLPLVLQSATRGILDAVVFHSFQDLNPGHADQVLSGTAPGGRVLQLGFEDLPAGTGDNDFQDVLLTVLASRDDVFFV
ncbi:M10 family metallopeptidase C-terminal domain-containing protein [Reyranella sp.]|uniref:M10 family metallopeptidase C-terminal domain-containing protein n=1 Tax=Reyranella sp. TaxID=1929291 RepID=UPI003BABC1D3